MTEALQISSYVGAVLDPMIAAELAFRGRAEAALRGGASLWFTLGKLEARLRLRVSATGRVAGRKERGRLADVRLRVGLGPARDPIASSHTGEHGELAIPTMSVCRRVDDQLEIAGFRADFRRGEVRLRAPNELLFVERWPTRWIAAIAAPLARWTSEAESSPSLTPHAAFEPIVRELDRLVTKFESVPSPAQSMFGELLGTYYRLETLEAEVEWRADDADESNPDITNPMLELRAVLDPSSDRACLRTTQNFAGVVRGARKRAIWAAILDAVDRLAASLDKLGPEPPSTTELSEVLARVGDSGTFIARRELGSPQHLALIRSDPDHFLMFELEITDPTEPHVSRVELLAAGWGTQTLHPRIGPLDADTSRLHAYLCTLLRSLYHVSPADP